jgi:hypothetical protein
MRTNKADHGKVKKSLVIRAVGPAIALAASATLAAPLDAYGSPSATVEAAGAAVVNPAAAGFFGRARLGTTPKGDELALDSVLEESILAPIEVRGSLDTLEEKPATPGNEFKLPQSGFGRKLSGTGAEHTGIFSQKSKVRFGDQPVTYGVPPEAGGPEKKVGFSVSGSAWAALSRIGGYRNPGSTVELPTPTDCCGSDPTLARTTLLASTRFVDATGTDFGSATGTDSTAEVRGVYVTEVGLGLSRKFHNGGGAYVLGLTPKYVIADVLDYQTDSSNSADSGVLNLSNAETYRHFNADLGIARDFGNGWRTGLVVKNVFAHEYETAQNGPIRLTPQARIDVARQIDW